MLLSFTFAPSLDVSKETEQINENRILKQNNSNNNKNDNTNDDDDDDDEVDDKQKIKLNERKLVLE